MSSSANDTLKRNVGMIFRISPTRQAVLQQQEPKQFIDFPDRPSHYEFALLSHLACQSNLGYGALPPGWRIYAIYSTSDSRLKSFEIPIQKDEKSKVHWAIVDETKPLTVEKKTNPVTLKEDLLDNGYVGVAYIHDDRKYLVLSHRGLSILNLGSLLGGYKVANNNINPQQVAALYAAQQCVRYAQDNYYKFFVTGHGLGGWLAEITVYHCSEENKPWFYRDISAVTFDAPGTGNMMAKMDSHLKDGRGVVREALDIVHYVSIPNLINTCNEQVGTVYRIMPNLPKRIGIAQYLLFNIDSHNMKHLLEAFDKETGKAKFRELMLDWPQLDITPTLELLSKLESLVTGGIGGAFNGVMGLLKDGEFRRLLGGSLKALFKEDAKFPALVGGEYGEFHKFAGGTENYQPDTETLSFESSYFLEYSSHYKAISDDPQQLCLVHFDAGVRRFLFLFDQLRKKITEKDLYEALSLLPEAGKKYLASCKLDIPKNVITQEAEKETSMTTTTVKLLDSSLGDVDDFRRYLTHALSLEPSLLNNLEKLNRSKGKQVRDVLSEVQSSIHILHTRMDSLEQNTILPRIPDELPAPAQYFVGRTREFAWIEEQFKQPGLMVIGVNGQGGSGKSQLAVEVAHRSKTSPKPYRLIRWLKADSKENLKNSYFSLGEDLGIERKDFKDSEESLRNAINHQLLRYEKILLIYDNVETPDIIEQYRPSAGGNACVHLIFTTRHHFAEWPMVEIPEFNDAEVYEYLHQRFKEEIDSELSSQFAKELGCLPLAIVQAAAYMAKYLKPLEVFIKLLQTETSRQKVFETSDSKLKTVATLWNITLEKLPHEALDTVRFCSYLDPDVIPRSLLEKYIGENNADEIIVQLRGQSLLTDVKERGNFFRIHRLLQEAIRRQLVSIDRSQQTTLVKTIIEKGIKALISVIGKLDPADAYSFWRKNDALVRQCHQLRLKGEQLGIDQTLLGTLYEYEGDYQRLILFNYAESLILHEYSLKLRREVYGDQHLDVAAALENIGNVFKAQSKYEEALKVLPISLNIRKAIYGDKHPGVASSLNIIGSIYYSHGKYEEALKYYSENLDIERTHFGNKEHTNVGILTIYIGHIHSTLGNYEDALKYYLESIAIYKTIYCQQLTTSTLLSNIELTYIKQNKNKEIQADSERHLVMSVAYDKKQPLSLKLLSSIAGIYDEQSKHEEALKYYFESLSLYRAVPNDQYPAVASINNIGLIYFTLRQYETALQCFSDCLVICKSIYGDKHPAAANALGNIGKVYSRQGKYEEALKYYFKSLDIQKVVFGDKHHAIANSFGNIGNVYDEQGNYTLALDYYSKGLAIRNMVHGSKHPAVATSLDNIGNAYYRQGNYEEALRYYQDSLAIRKAVHREHHPVVAISFNNIGNAYYHQGNYEEALRYYQDSLAIRKAVHREHHPVVAISLNNIGLVYSKQDKLEEALFYFEQGLAIFRAIYDEHQHPSIQITMDWIRTVKNKEALTKASSSVSKDPISKLMMIHSQNDTPSRSVSSHSEKSFTPSFVSAKKSSVSPSKILEETPAEQLTRLVKMIIQSLGKPKWINLDPDQPLDRSIYKDEPKTDAIVNLKRNLLLIQKEKVFSETIKQQLINLLETTIEVSEFKQQKKLIGGLRKSGLAIRLKEVLEKLTLEQVHQTHKMEPQ